MRSTRRLRAVHRINRELRRIVIVGGGRAGVAAAEELRRQGYEHEIVILSDEPDAPYDRPACSKGLLSGKKRPADAKMPYQKGLNINWQLGRTAVHLDPDNRYVVADTEEAYEYDGLIIATGSKPNRPRDWPLGEPGIHILHGITDAWALRHDLRRARRVAVVGGGLTGCEVACTVRLLARECVLIDSKPQVMTRAIGEVVGRYVTEEVARDGVHLRLGRRVRSINRRRRGWALELDDGSEEIADVVVGTLGAKPDTTWLASARTIDSSDGVLCDEYLRVVGAPDVVAAGDVARWFNLRHSATPTRPDSGSRRWRWGAAAAQLLAGTPVAAGGARAPVLVGAVRLRIQVCGQVPPMARRDHGDPMRPSRKDVARSGVMVGYYRDGVPIGLVAVNAMRAFTTSARMMLAAPTQLVDVDGTTGWTAVPTAPRHLAAVG